MLIRINPDNPELRKVRKVVECLNDGGIIIYPTDTVYGLGCDITNNKAVEWVCRHKGINPKKAKLSFICNDMSHLSDYALQFDNQTFKLMKQCLPGPYTFILKANNKVPKLFKSNKRTVAIRIPDNNIAQMIVQELGRPILSTSLKVDDEISEYLTDPTEIHEVFGKQVDLVVDGGFGKQVPSTVIDCSNSQPQLIREGAGEVEYLLQTN